MPSSNGRSAGAALLFVVCGLAGSGALFHAAPDIGASDAAAVWWGPVACTIGGALFGVLVASIYASQPVAGRTRLAILVGIAIGGTVGASLSIRWIRLIAELTAGASPWLTAAAATGALVVVGLAWAVGGAALGAAQIVFAAP